MKRKNLIKISLVALVVFVFLGVINVDATSSTGFTYDHAGKPIYSAEGFTVNETPYTYRALGINSGDLTSPSDLYVYSDANGQKTVYLLDSKSNKMFILNDELVLKYTVSSLNIDFVSAVMNNTAMNKVRSSGALVFTSLVSLGSVHKDGLDDDQVSSLVEYFYSVMTSTNYYLSKAHADMQTALLNSGADVSEYRKIVTELEEYEDMLEKSLENITEMSSEITIDVTSSKLTELNTLVNNVKLTLNSYINNFNLDTATRYKEAVQQIVTNQTLLNANVDVKAELQTYLNKLILDDIDVVLNSLPSAAALETVGRANLSDKSETETLEAFELVYNTLNSVNSNLEAINTSFTSLMTTTNPDFTLYEDFYNQVNDYLNTLISVNNEVQKFSASEFALNRVATVLTDLLGKVAPYIEEDEVKAAEREALRTLYTNQAITNALIADTLSEVKTYLANMTCLINVDQTIDLLMTQAQSSTIAMNSPESVWRAVNPNTGKDYIYIADAFNSQVLVLDATTFDETDMDYDVVQAVTKPEQELGSNNFNPLTVVCDNDGRMYIIAQNITDGIMQFSANGEFNSYTGVNYVTLTAWEIFWRNFSTEAQKEKSAALINTTFTSVVYRDHMLYTTSYAIRNSRNEITNDTIMIKKINTSGKDVLRRNGYNPPKGDVEYPTSNDRKGAYSASRFESITINEYGVYTVVDSNRGRLFTYDNEGNLLYISGGTGNYIDDINQPIAVQYLGDDLLVLDANSKTIIKFEPTEIALQINNAVYQESLGRVSRDGIRPIYNDTTKTWWIDEIDTKITLVVQDAQLDSVVRVVDGVWWIGDTNTGIAEEPLAAADYWAEVIRLNANYEYAYIGIGHRYMKEKNYKEAMKYFELGADKVYYGKAFKQYRDSLIKRYFEGVAIAAIVLYVGYKGYKIYRRKKLGIKPVEDSGMGDE